jgi:multicomponent K+:H+ antiporter subunit G
MSPTADLIVTLLLLVGGAFTLLGSLGLVRFSDVLLRLHGPTKAGTLGVGCVLIASAVYFSSSGDGISVHELLITLFIFLTAPVSAQMMAKCAMFLARRQRESAHSRE